MTRCEVVSAYFSEVCARWADVSSSGRKPFELSMLTHCNKYAKTYYCRIHCLESCLCFDWVDVPLLYLQSIFYYLRSFIHISNVKELTRYFSFNVET